MKPTLPGGGRFDGHGLFVRDRVARCTDEAAQAKRMKPDLHPKILELDYLAPCPHFSGTTTYRSSRLIQQLCPAMQASRSSMPSRIRKWRGPHGQGVAGASLFSCTLLLRCSRLLLVLLVTERLCKKLAVMDCPWRILPPERILGLSFCRCPCSRPESR